MLQAMRRNMKLVLWFTVIFFVLLIFLVWGADLQFGGQAATPDMIGKVNGETIPTTIYQQAVATSRQTAQSQGGDLTPNDELALEQQAWDNIVDEILLRQEAEKRGLGVSDEELKTVIRNDPPPIITQDPAFHNESGAFDLATYQARLRDPATPEFFLIQLENYVRETLPLQKVQEVVVRSVRITDDELRQEYESRNGTARITYVQAEAFRQTPASSRITDEEVREYYEAHREQFLEPARVELHYVLVPRQATAQDSLDLQTELREFAESARTFLAAEERGEVDISVNDFATLAETFSDLPSAENGGLSAGFLKPSEMSASMLEAVEGLAPGQISEPFREGEFYHIVMVEGVEEQDGERAVQIRDLGLKIAPSDSTVLATEDMLDEVRNAARTKGLEAAAEPHGLQVRTIPDVRRDGIVPGLASLPGLGEFAHESPPGTLSRVYAANNAWYLLEVGAHKPEDFASIDEAEGRIRADILRERRSQAAREVVERVLGRIKLGEGLEAAAEAESLTVTTTPVFTRSQGVPALGQDPNVVGAAFMLPVGELSEPVESTRGWMLIRVDERPEVDWEPFEGQKPGMRQILRATRQNEALETFLQELRRRAKIEDYRAQILG